MILSLVSNGGKAVWFDETAVRSMGRNARGVRGMKLPDESIKFLSLLVAFSESESVLVATENGYGKRTQSYQNLGGLAVELKELKQSKLAIEMAL
jgi:DNA gyrase/topoisomerase IV subunit A